MAKADLTAARLRELFNFDPETGLFTRLKRTGSKDRFEPWRGTVARCGELKYAHLIYVIGVDGRNYSAHRLAWLYMTGEWPAQQIDHIDGNSLNNVWSNLRSVSSRDNSRNLPIPKSNTSGVMGVNWRESKRKWRAFITIARKMIHLGYFLTKEEAIEARRAAEVAYGFHPNHGRPSTRPRLQE